MRDGGTGKRKEMSESTRGVFSNLNSEKNGTTAEEVVTRLREMIQNGDLAAGDRLPPERDLAKLLGVSRSAAYRAAASGQLPTITFGRRLLVPTSRLLEMLGLPVEEQP